MLLADDLAAADPQTRIQARPVAFYGRTAHAAGTWDGQAERHRQPALRRAVVTAYGGQVTAQYFDESCRADHPWSCRPQGQTLLATLSGPAHPSWTLVAADAWRLIPRRTPADGTEILHQLAQRHVLLVLADTGAAVLTAGGVRPARRAYVRHCQQRAGDRAGRWAIPPAAFSITARPAASRR